MAIYILAGIQGQSSVNSSLKPYESGDVMMERSEDWPEPKEL